MRKTALPLVLLATALVCALPAAPAFATGVKRTFVSGVGDDTHVSTQCQLSAPCRTFSAAYSVTIPDGEINVLDPASYGTLTITQGLSIQAHGWASITSQVVDAAITVQAGPSDKINLQGLLLDGAGSGINGIRFTSGGFLDIQDCVIRNFQFSGIVVSPSASTVKVSVANTLLSDMTVGYGFQISLPLVAGTESVVAVLDHVRSFHNSRGIQIGSGATSGTINVMVSDSTIANNNQAGIEVDSGAGATTNVMVRNSTIADNVTDGFFVNGPTATVRVTRSSITGHATAFVTQSGGSLVSFGDNSIDGNTSNGTVTSTIGYH